MIKSLVEYISASMILLVLLLLISYVVLQFVVGIDSTRTLEIHRSIKLGGALLGFVVAAIFWFDYFLGPSKDSFTSTAARSKAAGPATWVLVGVLRGVVVSGCFLIFGWQLCAMLAIYFEGHDEKIPAKIDSVRRSVDLFGREGLHVNCKEYVYLNVAKYGDVRLCYKRRRTESDRLSTMPLMHNQNVMLRVKNNVLGIVVEAIETR